MDPTAARPSSTDLVGRVFGKYEIVRLLGAGGMGRVYEGLNTAIGKRVALKFIERDAATTDAVARFQREAQAASAVESAHIVEIFDTGVSDEGMPFIVMELLRGEDLGHRIRRLGRLELAEALVITAQILRGLHRAHEVGIVHRDLKPDNIFLLDRDDDLVFAKIVDFGVSKITRRGDARSTTITQEGTVLGTPVYMSPEQAQALADVDGRADLWSAGAILYECLSGRPPHSGGSYEQVIVNICMKDVDDIRLHNPGVPEGIAKVVARALTRDRLERFQTARDFLDALVPESGGVLSARSLSASDARKASTPTPSAPVAPGPATLGAVSTVAALPSSMAPARHAAPSDARPTIYMGVAIGAVLLGAILAVGVTLVRNNEDVARVGIVSSAAPAPASPSEQGRSSERADDGASSRTAMPAEVTPPEASSSPATASAVVTPSSPGPAAISAAPSAPALTVQSALPRVGPGPLVPQKGGLGGDLELQRH